MELLTGDLLMDRLAGVVHRETQSFSSGIDLTVAAVAAFTSAGALDFGGSEFEAAAARAMEPELADPGDDYGWWELQRGRYRIRFNERVDLGEGEMVLVTPHRRLLDAGAHHPAFLATAEDDDLTTLLTVAAPSCRLKENCRIARALVLG